VRQSWGLVNERSNEPAGSIKGKDLYSLSERLWISRDASSVSLDSLYALMFDDTLMLPHHFNRCYWPQQRKACVNTSVNWIWRRCSICNILLIIILISPEQMVLGKLYSEYKNNDFGFYYHLVNYILTSVKQRFAIRRWRSSVLRHLFFFNLLKPTGYVMHQQFNIQQLYVLPTLYLCVLYLSENKQRLVPLTA
jgi:hypothetical protein